MDFSTIIIDFSTKTIAFSTKNNGLFDIGGEQMNFQSYYRLKQSNSGNICDMTESLLVNCAGFSSQKVNRQLIRHDYYLIYAVEGELNIHINSKKFQLVKGQFIIIAPETKIFYQTHKDSKISYFWLHFTGRDASDILVRYGISPNTIYDVGIHNKLQNLWHKIFNELLLLDVFFNDSTALILNEILISLSRYVNKSSISSSLSKSIVYIHENYSDEIDIESLAQMENMSLSLFRIKFRELTGYSPKDYIIEIRMEYALRHLNGSDMNIKEIASAIGYKDVYYFSRIFKKKTGLSPTAYREKINSTQQDIS